MQMVDQTWSNDSLSNDMSFVTVPVFKKFQEIGTPLPLLFFLLG
jgi:hypothetical protein